MTEDNRCSLPFTGFHVLNLKNNTFAACCRTQHDPIDKDTGVLTSSLIELRKSVINNERNSQCTTCWERDDKTGMSYRRMWSAHILHPDVWKDKWDTLDPYQPVGAIEVAFSNKCQLMCIYCSPNVSSMWQDSQHKFSKKFKVYELNSTPPSCINDILDVSKLKRISITGGEPMMEPTCINFLKELEPDMDRYIVIITNLSYGDATFNILLDIIERHKRVGIAASLDSLGENITRKYLNWDLWKRNFEELAGKLNERKKIYPDIILNIVITVTLLNYKDVQSIIDYILSFRRQGISISFGINPIADRDVLSLKSGRLDPNFSIQLQQDDIKLLTEKEYNQINSFNKLINGTILDKELEILTQEYLKEYLK